MKKIFLILIAISFFTLAGFSQQIPLYSQYMFNKLLLNPAVTGNTDAIELRLTARQQWVGIEKAPSTQVISGHLRLNNGTMGVGGVIYADRFGPESKIGLQGNYSYIIPVFNEEGRLSFGLSFQVFQYQMDYANFTFLDIDDSMLAYNKENSWRPESDIGIYLYGANYFAGISANQLIALPVKIGGDEKELNKLVRHYNLMGGYNFSVGRDFNLEPSTLLKTSFKAPFQADVNIKGIYQKDYWLGFSYRTSGDIITMLGFTYKDFVFGLAYDLATSKLIHYQNGTFEIMLGYNIPITGRTGISRF